MASPTVDRSAASAELTPVRLAAGSGAMGAGTVADRVAGSLTVLLFIALFYQPATTLLKDWWTIPEAGHGLLLAPVAVWFAWKEGLLKDRSPDTKLGVAMLMIAVLMRFAAGMAAELFTMR